VTAFLARYPTGFASWLTAAAAAVEGIDEIAVVGDARESATEVLLSVATEGEPANRVVAASAEPDASAIELLAGRSRIDGRPTAFVCRDFACRLPVTDPMALRAQLGERVPA
jgi:uncharacterized protein